MKFIVIKSCYLACVSLVIVGLIQNAIASSWNQRNVKNDNLGLTTNGFIPDGSSQDKISDERQVDDTSNTLTDQNLLLEKIASLINAKRRLSWPPSYALPMAGLSNYEKRQIRYHQCYFNPISCFRKRK